nr:uncharacterized protein LOC105086388 isoform X2 [Camelus dromedarius]
MPTPVCIRPQARKRHPYRQTNSPPFDGAVALHLLAKANMNFYFGAEMCSVFPEDRGDQQDEYYSSHFTNEEIGTQRSSLTYTDAALVPPSLDWWYQDTWVSSTFCNEFTCIPCRVDSSACSSIVQVLFFKTNIPMQNVKKRSFKEQVWKSKPTTIIAALTAGALAARPASLFSGTATYHRPPRHIRLYSVTSMSSSHHLSACTSLIP